MPLIEIQDQKTWDGFVASLPNAQFSQSWTWGEFQLSRKHPVKRFFFKQGEKVLLAAQIIGYKKRLSGYWFAPRGPVFAKDLDLSARRKAMFDFLLALSNQKLAFKPLFFRVEPPVRLDQAEGLFPPRMRRNHSMSPASTSILDLQKSEEDLLKAMHTKTRYNIRVAQKHEVIIREAKDEKDVQAFLDLTAETGERNAITPQASSYLRATFEFLSEKNMATIRLAEKDGKILAANMEILSGDTVTYLHGASSSSSRELMAPYGLHWEAIQSAKSQGFKSYDFWGCNPSFVSSYYYKKSWEGISRFKEGWGGELIDLVGTWDLPVNRVLYRLAFPGGFMRG